MGAIGCCSSYSCDHVHLTRSSRKILAESKSLYVAQSHERFVFVSFFSRFPERCVRKENHREQKTRFPYNDTNNEILTNADEHWRRRSGGRVVDFNYSLIFFFIFPSHFEFLFKSNTLKSFIHQPSIHSTPDHRNHKITSYILRFPLSFVSCLSFLRLFLLLSSVQEHFLTSSMVCDALRDGGAYYDFWYFIHENYGLSHT